MKPYPNPDHLAARWQHLLEMDIEMGNQPLLGLGMNSFLPDDGLALLAIGLLARRHPTLVEPILVVGGEGDLWLPAAMQWNRGGGAIYGGNDVATYGASLNVITPTRSDTADPRLPAGMAWMLTSIAGPGGQRADVEDLPFLLASEQFVPVTAPPTPPTWIDYLETGGVLLLALGLILAAWLL